MRKVASTTVLAFALLLTSCHKDMSSVEKMMRTWVGCKLMLPNGPFLNIEGDTFPNYPDKSLYKIVCYIDSAGCTGCRLSVSQWKSLIETINRKGLDASVLLYISPKDERDVWGSLISNGFTYPVCVDVTDRFGQLNKLPEQDVYRTFLLNGEDEIVAIGNPAHNEKVKELYLDILGGVDHHEQDAGMFPLTTAILPDSCVSLGRFNHNEEQSARFAIRNTGNAPLYIFGATTSCDCLHVDYPQESISPGEVLYGELTYKGNKPGHIRKSAYLRCNTSEALRLTVTGDAKQ